MIAFSADDPDSADARVLLGELGQVLVQITGDSGAASFDAADVRGAGAAFLVARTRDGAPLGCGGLRPFAPGIAELKRMYARPGSGAGQHLLRELELRALALGYRELWLETRRVNLRAVGFYTRHGYLAIDNYGKYAGRDDAICMAKSLHENT